MTQNKQIALNFVQNDNIKTKAKHLFIEKNAYNIKVLYSYGYHFPLSIKLTDNTFLINSDNYSNTTARHKSLLCYALKSTNFKELQKQSNSNIMFFTTKELLNILSNGILTKNQLIEDKI